MVNELLSSARNWMYSNMEEFVESTLAEMVDRFRANVLPEPNSGCWFWMGSDYNGGYGYFCIQAMGKRKVIAAHRFAYELLVGPIPEGYDVHHKCSIPCCVNPLHLEPLDRMTHVHITPRNIGSINAAKTHCINGHPLTGDDVRIRGNSRQCKACAREWYRDHPGRRKKKPHKAKELWKQRDPKTHCKYGHELSGYNIRLYLDPNGKEKRVCRACYERNKQALMVKGKEERRIARAARGLKPINKAECRQGHPLYGDNLKIVFDSKGRRHRKCLECVRLNNIRNNPRNLVKRSARRAAKRAAANADQAALF